MAYTILSFTSKIWVEIVFTTHKVREGHGSGWEWHRVYVRKERVVLVVSHLPLPLCLTSSEDCSGIFEQLEWFWRKCNSVNFANTACKVWYLSNIWHFLTDACSDWDMIVHSVDEQQTNTEDKKHTKHNVDHKIFRFVKFPFSR